MSLINEQQLAQLLKNGSAEHREKDHFPVVKLVMPDTNATWHLTEIDPGEPDMAFGLCDLGFAGPPVRLSRIRVCLSA